VTDHQQQPVKRGVILPISTEMLAALASTVDAFTAALAAPLPTPAEAAARRERARIDRATERQTAAVVPLALDALVERRGWSREYATHLVQPYCRCYEGSDGWEVCEHAYDLEVTG
jgi:hypothetical protein